MERGLVKRESLMLCPFCKKSAIVAMTPFQVTLFNLGFVFIAPNAHGFCPKCERLIISVKNKLFIELEEPKDGAN